VAVDDVALAGLYDDDPMRLGHDSGILYRVRERGAPPVLTRADQVRQIMYCTPGIGPAWSRYFVTRYCYTSDEGRNGQVSLIPAFSYSLEKCKAFEDGVDHHGEKTRQMMITWLTAGCHLGRTMFGRNASGFLTSRKEKLVDDGGQRSTINSIFGRMRFIYRHLPDWMQEERPVNFSHLRMDCEKSGGYVVGEGATGEGGRSGTFGRADVDEAAFMPGEGWWRALRAACPNGVGLNSTPNGNDNIFSRIKHDTPGHFRFLRYHWSRHPVKAIGLYQGEDGKLRSPWYDNETASLTKDEVAREYDISYAHSVTGQAWPEFDEDRHIADPGVCIFDPTLPLYGGIDFGMGAATALVFFQVHGREMWIIADYEVWNADVDDHAPAIAKLLNEVTGGRVDRHEVYIYGDPAGNAREMTNKHSTVIRAYQPHGFKRMQATTRQPLKDGLRLMRRKFHRDEVVIDPVNCRFLQKRIPDLRYKTDPMGRVIADVLEENSAKHICDAVRYGAQGVYRVDEDYSAVIEQPAITVVSPHSPDRRSRDRYEPSGVSTIAAGLDTRY